MKLGPTFIDELRAAGLFGLDFSWDDRLGTITDYGTLTPNRRATLDAVVAAHDPGRQISVTRTVSRKSWNDAVEAAGKLDAWLALSFDTTVKTKDRAYLMSGGDNGDYLESNVKLARLAAKAGIDLKAAFDAATG